MLLNAYWVPVPRGLTKHKWWYPRGGEGHGQRHCWSQKKSRQPRCPNVESIHWNDCPSLRDYPLPTHFSLKCLFLNDVYDRLNHTLRGLVLDAPSGRLASRPPHQQPRRPEASAHRQLLWLRLWVFHLLILWSTLPSSYLLPNCVCCLATMRQMSLVRLQLLHLKLNI